MRTKHSLLTLVSHLCLGTGIIALFLTLLLASTPVRAQAAANQAFVRVIHASPDIATADVFVDGQELLSSFEFGAVTDYVAVPAGPHKVQISAMGKGIGAAMLTQTLTVSPGFVYTVAATGTSATSLALIVFVDNNILTPGTAKLRLYHLSPDAGSVSVDASEKPLMSGVIYKQSSDYLSLAAGSYDFGVDATTGTNLSKSATLGANTVTSIFVLGLDKGVPHIELVSSTVPGLPKLPNTGSNPYAQLTGDSAQPLTPLTWLLGGLSIILLGSWGFLRYLASKKQ